MAEKLLSWAKATLTHSLTQLVHCLYIQW